jgi:two-component system, cell cycle sensor histidine kinase and response regulator CckA
MLKGTVSSSPGDLPGGKHAPLFRKGPSPLDWIPLAVLIPSILLVLAIEALESTLILDPLPARSLRIVAVVGVSISVLLLMTRMLFVRKLLVPLVLGVSLLVMSQFLGLLKQFPPPGTSYPLGMSDSSGALVRRSCLWGGFGFLMTSMYLAVIEVRRMHLRSLNKTVELDQEVQERKRIEQELRASEQKYRAVLETSAEGFLIFDKKGRLLEANDAFLTLLGYSRDELLTMSLGDIEAQENQDETTIHLQSIIERGYDLFETFLLAKDGMRKQVEVAVSHWAIGDGLFFSFCRDIYQRKQAAEALRQSEAKYRALVETTFDMVWEINPEGQITYVSPRIEDLLGYQPNEVVGKAPFDFMPDEEALRIRQLFEEKAVLREPIIGLENANRHRDGHIVVMEASGVPYYSIEGVFMGYRGTDRDITERKRIEKERLEIERRLLHTQKLESLGVLAGGIAHDYNNILTAIQGNLELALLDLLPATPTYTGIEQAIHATRRAADLTRQMLAYSGRGRYLVTQINLGGLVRENIDLFRAIFTRSVKLEVSSTSDRSMIQADPGQVQQVILNLLTNSVEAMDGKPGVVNLITGVTDCDEAYLSQSRFEERPIPGPFAYVEVSDTGCGMDEQTLQRLFDPFFTTKFIGRGLGMSALLGIVRGHKGAIMVKSAVGQGTTIRVLFPICADETASHKGETLSSPPS